MIAITADQVRRLAPRARPDIVRALVDGAGVLARYEITTPGRLCHFMAQAAHESDGFQTTQEYWGPTPAQKRYEGRADIGNVRPGDGKRFMGRGIFQLTGRANYRAYGERLGINLEASPEKAAEPSRSLLIACEYWKVKGLNALADRDDVKAITKRINGGTNGLADRREYLAKAKMIWGKASVPQPAASDDVKELQGDLTALGHVLTVDGHLGPKTEAAIKAFQKSAGIKVDGIAGPATRDAIRAALLKRTVTGEPPKLASLFDAVRTPEGLATAGGIATTVFGAAANPGPLQWALAAVVVVALAAGVVFLVKRMRAA